jgi:hypothetical protein
MFVLTALSAMNGVGVVHDWVHGSSAATAFTENAKSTTASAVQIIMDADMGPDFGMVWVLLHGSNGGRGRPRFVEQRRLYNDGFLFTNGCNGYEYAVDVGPGQMKEIPASIEGMDI